MIVRLATAALLALGLAAGSTPGAGLASTVTAPDAAGMSHRELRDPLFGIVSLIPTHWRDIGNGIHARGQPPQDLALIALQSVPASVEQLWPQLLPQLALAEVPEPDGELTTDSFHWTLYVIETQLPGADVAVHLGLAHARGVTYLVLLQSAPGESAVLREAVFLPAIEAFAPLPPEPTPAPSTLGYRAEEVAFPGGSEDVRLAGTLTLPPGPGPHPAIVLMSGSGPQDRDESLRPVTTLAPFALIADALTRAGVAVLRYDDRGVGASTGDHAAATVAELTLDGRAAIDYLATRADVDPLRIGILGHSEGAIYAATLAADDPRVAFAVAMAPPAVDGSSLLVAQGEAIARAGGSPQAEIDAAAAFGRVAYPAARDGDLAAVEEALREAAGAQWDRLTEDARALLGERAAFVQRQVDLQLPVLTSAWFRSLLASDPAADWSRVSVPVLGLFGGLDTQVPLDPNEPAWRAALEAAGNEDVTSVVIDDANHLFQPARTGSPAEYGSLPPTFAETFLPALVEWVATRAGVGD